MPNSAGSLYTKKLLTASLKKWMAQKPLNKISIRDITDDCGVNRQTFYHHFEDIYAQVKWMYEQEAISLLKEHEGVLLWQEGLLQLLRYIEENRAVCLCAYHSLGYEHLKRFFSDDIHAIIKNAVSEIGSKLGFPLVDEYVNFVTHYYTVALASLVESWLLGEIDKTPAELIAFMDIIFQDHIRGATLRLKESGLI